MLVKVSTGAVLPPGADTVVIQERARRTGAELHVLAGERVGANVRQAGEGARAGDTALPAGTRIGPVEVGYLASLGVADGCASLESGGVFNG